MTKPIKHPIEGTMSDKDLFEAWAAQLGKSSHLAEAAALIGINDRTLTRIRSGDRALSRAERLAMSALRANLPEWAPEVDETCRTLKLLNETIVNK